MLTQSVSCDDVSSATVQALRVASRVEVTGNDEPGVNKGSDVFSAFHAMQVTTPSRVSYVPDHGLQSISRTTAPT